MLNLEKLYKRPKVFHGSNGYVSALVLVIFLGFVIFPVACQENYKMNKLEDKAKLRILAYKNGIKKAISPESQLFKPVRDTVAYIWSNVDEFMMTAFTKKDVENFKRHDALEVIYADSQEVKFEKLEGHMAFKRLLLIPDDYDEAKIMIIYGLDSYRSGPAYYSGEATFFIRKVIRSDTNGQ